jgi:hypothetical protein
MLKLRNELAAPIAMEIDRLQQGMLGPFMKEEKADGSTE